MGNKELIESFVPDFIDVTVTTRDCEQEHIEEIIAVEAENDGETYRSEMAFEDADGDLTDLKSREAEAMIKRVVGAAIEDM